MLEIETVFLSQQIPNWHFQGFQAPVRTLQQHWFTSQL